MKLIAFYYVNRFYIINKSFTKINNRHVTLSKWVSIYFLLLYNTIFIFRFFFIFIDFKYYPRNIVLGCLIEFNGNIIYYVVEFNCRYFCYCFTFFNCNWILHFVVFLKCLRRFFLKEEVFANPYSILRLFNLFKRLLSTTDNNGSLEASLHITLYQFTFW